RLHQGSNKAPTKRPQSHLKALSGQNAGLRLLRRGGEGEVPDGLVHVAAEGLLKAFEGGRPEAGIHGYLRRKGVRRKGDDPALPELVRYNRRGTVGIGAEDAGFPVGQRNFVGTSEESLVPELEVE